MKITDDMLTGWFPGDVKPVRVGEYERLYGNNPYIDKWNGQKWVYGPAGEECFTQIRPWRGLKEPQRD